MLSMRFYAVLDQNLAPLLMGIFIKTFHWSALFFHAANKEIF
jgi:hypothetical protein